ncbi:MAG: alpha/beta hydrolase [Rhodanobacter sp.]
MQRPALYLLAGLLCDETIWDQQVRSLSTLATTRAMDFRGFESIPAMARHVLANAPVTFSLAGHSMGARVALEVARIAPERVERLALMDTGIHPVQPGEAVKRQELIDLANRHGMAALAARWLPPMLHPDHLAGSTLLPILTSMVERMTPAIFAGQVRALLDRPDATEMLPGLRCPVLIGVGREDAWSPPEQHHFMAQRIPDARLVIFENSGHMAPLEAPDVVSSAMASWLATPTERHRI